MALDSEFERRAGDDEASEQDTVRDTRFARLASMLWMTEALWIELDAGQVIHVAERPDQETRQLRPPVRSVASLLLMPCI